MKLYETPLTPTKTYTDLPEIHHYIIKLLKYFGYKEKCPATGRGGPRGSG